MTKDFHSNTRRSTLIIENKKNQMEEEEVSYRAMAGGTRGREEWSAVAACCWDLCNGGAVKKRGELEGERAVKGESWDCF